MLHPPGEDLTGERCGRDFELCGRLFVFASAGVVAKKRMKEDASYVAIVFVFFGGRQFFALPRSRGGLLVNLSVLREGLKHWESFAGERNLT